ncbi:MAG: carboxynorspermidine decarboxylase [Clostridiales bacterium]|nr:carboxynorspermidine decarboxylase [Clostridiales bacterium]
MKYDEIKTPCYVVELDKLKKNLERLKEVEEKSGAHVLLAQKAFSMFSLYPFIGQYLSGTTASGLFEARLGAEEMPGKQVHVYAPAFKREDMEELCRLCDHIVFNTPRQWRSFAPIIRKYNEQIEDCKKRISCGLRINPEYSEIETDIYNPCFTGSRLGTTLAEFERAWNAGELNGMEGLHFHTMCEQNSDTLERTLRVVEEKFGRYLSQMKWLNLGGGHHITREDYDVERLVRCIRELREHYGTEVYLEPGEAVALQAGYLLTSVLDVHQNGMELAILDTSAACHMPDVLEMPYRPVIEGAADAGERTYTYRLGGPTCLAGDVIGDYSFDKPLKPGDRLKLKDMAIYSMVKNNTFNGMPLPSICVETGGDIRVIKEFGYQDFKDRLS